MKKTFILLVITFFVSNSFAQKNKSKVTLKNPIVYAKVDNLIAEVKNGNFQITINENGVSKEAITIKSIDSKFSPVDCKLISLKANGVTLYLLSWSENTIIKTELKTDESLTVYSNIYDLSSKNMVFTNKQVSSHIIEKVFLDKLKNASETQEKKRNEGLEFKLNSDGSILLKSKTQQNKLIYDIALKQFVNSKK